MPGGLGAASLASYARINYGVDMTEEEAAEWRETFLTKVYPEIGWYLESDVAEVLAENLGSTPREVLKEFRGEPSVLAAKRIVQGRNTKRNGESYNPAFIDRVWETLICLNRNPSLEPMLVSEAAGEQLERKLFLGTVVTNTGRVRGAATFTQRRNTPFQAMAADGTKLALWELHKHGYHVVAFIHDEFVIALAEHADHAKEAQAIDRICRDCAYLLQQWCKSLRQHDLSVAAPFALPNIDHSTVEIYVTVTKSHNFTHPHARGVHETQ